MSRCSHDRRRPIPLRAQRHSPAFELLEQRKLLSVRAAPEMFGRPMAGAIPAGSSAGVGYTPTQIRHAFGFDSISFGGGVSGDGSGQTVAVISAFDNPKFVNSTSSS